MTSNLELKKTAPKVVITDSDVSDADVEESILKEIGAKVIKHQLEPTDNARDYEDKTIALIEDADAAMIVNAPMSARVLSSSKILKLIVRYGVGYDNIDVEAATENGIIACNVPDFMTFEVSDHTIMFVLALCKSLPWYHNMVVNRNWKSAFDWIDRYPMTKVDGKTVGVIGLGNIGSQVARKLSVFNVRILGHDPFLSDNEIKVRGAEPADLETILKEADIITLHTPLTETSRHMIGANELAKMKRTAMLINTSRGGLVDQNALYDALKTKRIRGAALDVFEREPVDRNDPILELDNVILTPHVAGLNHQALADLRTLASREVLRVLQGKRPLHPLNPEVLAKARAYKCKDGP